MGSGMGEQSIRQTARRAALDAQATIRAQWAERERRLSACRTRSPTAPAKPAHSCGRHGKTDGLPGAPRANLETCSLPRLGSLIRAAGFPGHRDGA